MITVKVTLPDCGESIYISSMYRPPRHDHNGFARSLVKLDSLGLFDCARTPYILAGDFNALSTDWDPSCISNAAGTVICEAASLCGLEQVIRGQGTRLSNGKYNLLDLVFTNRPDLVHSFSVLPPLSDHCPVTCSFSMPLGKQRSSEQLPPQYLPDWKHFPYRDFNIFLSHQPLLECMKGGVHVDHQWEAWNCIVTDAINRFMVWKPVRNKPQHHSPGWFTPYLHRLRKRVNRLYRQHHSHPEDHVRLVCYRLSRNYYRSCVRKAHSRFASANGHRLHANHQHGSYTWWQQAKRICNIGQGKTPIPDLHDGSTPATTDQAKSEVLCSFFAKQCTINPPASQTSLPSQQPGSKRDDKFDLPTITPEQVNL